MITDLVLSSLGPIEKLEAKGLQNINLLIGKNGMGKTFLLKALYASVKTIELYKRGQNIRSDKDILSDKHLTMPCSNSLLCLPCRGCQAVPAPYEPPVS